MNLYMMGSQIIFEANICRLMKYVKHFLEIWLSGVANLPHSYHVCLRRSGQSSTLVLRISFLLHKHLIVSSCIFARRFHFRLQLALFFSDPVKTDDDDDDDDQDEEESKRPPKPMSAAERNYSEFIRSLAAKYQRNGADHR